MYLQLDILVATTIITDSVLTPLFTIRFSNLIRSLTRTNTDSLSLTEYYYCKDVCHIFYIGNHLVSVTPINLSIKSVVAASIVSGIERMPTAASYCLYFENEITHNVHIFITTEDKFTDSPYCICEYCIGEKIKLPSNVAGRTIGHIQIYPKT